MDNLGARDFFRFDFAPEDGLLGDICDLESPSSSLFSGSELPTLNTILVDGNFWSGGGRFEVTEPTSAVAAATVIVPPVDLAWDFVGEGLDGGDGIVVDALGWGCMVFEAEVWAEEEMEGAATDT